MRHSGIAALAAAALCIGWQSHASAEETTCSLKIMAKLAATSGADGSLLVPVTVNGTDQAFALDTASPYTRVSKDDVGKLGLKTQKLQLGTYSNSSGAVNADLGLSTQRAGTSLISKSGLPYSQGTTLSSLKIGSNQASDLHVLVDPGTDTFDGALGSDLLSRFDLELDPASNTANLFSQDHCPGKVVYWGKAFVEIPFQLSDGYKIQIPVTLNGKPLTAIVDTSAPNTELTTRGQHELGIDATSPGVEPTPDAAEPFRIRLNQLDLKGITVFSLTVYLQSNAAEIAFRRAHTDKQANDPIYGAQLDVAQIPHLVIGLNVLRQLHVYIDYKDGALFVTGTDAK